MKPMLLLLLISLMMAACSPSRRLERLLRKHPELKSYDTIILRDTIPVPGVSADTILPLLHIPDTVVVEKGRLQIVLRKVRDTLFLRGKCKPDTVIIHRKIPVERIRIVRADARFALLKRIPWLASALIVLLIVILVIFLLTPKT